MSQPQLTFDLNRIQLLGNSVLKIFQNQPVGCTIALSVLTCLWYTFRHTLRSPAYPNIDGPPRKSFFSGHLFELFSPHNIAFHDHLQDTYGSVSKVYGEVGREDLYVSDPRFTHEVLVKSVDTVFRHPQYMYDINTAAFGLGLLSTAGDLHKGQRKMLNPVFTIKHMKSQRSFSGGLNDSLTPPYFSTQTATFNMIAQNMKTAMVKDLGGAKHKEIDVLRWCSATALELIGQAGLGHTFGIYEGKDSEYIHAVKNFLPALAKVRPFRALFPLIYRIVPAPLQRKLAEWVPNPHIRALKKIVDIQDKQAQDILTRKKEALKDKRTSEEMHDIMSVLLKANMEADEKDRLPEDQLLGQMNTLIFAGHETTSGALARILQLLASNPGIQDRLRAELEETPGTLSYDELNALPYLDALCRENLRLSPPAPVLERVALKDWVVPLRYPLKGKDGNAITEIKVRKGTRVYVGLREANRCKETWGEDADEFKPDRWLTDLPSSVTDAKTPGVYSSMMSFSAGPRACIGFKFSLLELKIVLSTLIKSFNFAPGTTEVTWLACGTMVPFPAGTKDYITEKKQPHMPLIVSVN
ncbi:cytochrome P450 family protein [Rhizoctonia solani AG-3 Rhs1AP]|uniref:Cytochrome P450 family protein n=2 Tax=Rhizoctonia solani AG-3 TaxID=1086053 RepID=A0A074S063_9AGAM|nr:cytochrome P450 family protein [Rhizoctonia solani AG-3 Rhs1AP]KEP50258.1 cytochrome P450 family protein [Rhizoctonia solani 123E]